MTESAAPGQRLDSWKSIAQYLQRDVATVRRWEKLLGLPIHRVGLTGRSVFAYTGEVDEWLTCARPSLPLRDAPVPSVPTAHPAAREVVARLRAWRWLIVTGAVVTAVAFGIYARKVWMTPATDLRFAVTESELIARTQAGVERWRHRFPTTFDTARLAQMIYVGGGAHPSVYFATRVQGREPVEQAESGTLTLLDLEGQPQRAFSFTDQVTFDGKSYSPPWALTAFAVEEAEGMTRVAVAAHHYIWDPGLVTVLDDQWRRRGTFVNAGWIEAVRWLGPDRLLIAGFSNARDGGMIALLDAAALDGQGPEPSDSPHFCEDCGPDRPLRMFVFPRTEVNRATASRFNRTIVQTFAGGRVVARTIEMSSPAGDADVVYEFTAPALDFVSAKFSERYWETHRELEAEGKITHTRQKCPDRDGPRELLAWEPATGWRTIRIR